MGKFQIVSDFKPTGDQPQAIDKLAKVLLETASHLTSGNTDKKGYCICEK